jgi:hypothetical protein
LAVADPIFAVFISTAAFDWVIQGIMGTTTDVAADSVSLKLADGVAGSMTKAVASGALPEGGPGLKAPNQCAGTKGAEWGL